MFLSNLDFAVAAVVETFSSVVALNSKVTMPILIDHEWV